MIREAINHNDFFPHEIALLQQHVDDLAPLLRTIGYIDLFVEGGVGRGIFALLLAQRLSIELGIPDAKYVGFDVLPWVTGHKAKVYEMTPDDIRSTLYRQDSFSAHGEVEYSEVNQRHQIATVNPDNNILWGNCFRSRDANKVCTALGSKNPVIIVYDANGALLDESDHDPISWFNPDLPYRAWIFLGHHPTPWSTDTAQFLWRSEWEKIRDCSQQNRLATHLLRHGIVAIRNNNGDSSS